ncbi:hypothetical protein ACX3U9_04625 [Corynebacterium pyruviciproducens]
MHAASRSLTIGALALFALSLVFGLLGNVGVVRGLTLVSGLEIILALYLYHRGTEETSASSVEFWLYSALVVGGLYRSFHAGYLDELQVAR